MQATRVMSTMLSYRQRIAKHMKLTAYCGVDYTAVAMICRQIYSNILIAILSLMLTRIFLYLFSQQNFRPEYEIGGHVWGFILPFSGSNLTVPIIVNA